MKAHAPQAVLWDILGKIACQIVRTHQIAQLVHKDIAVILVVVAVAADLFVQLLRCLDLRKVFLESSTNGRVRMLDFVFADSCSMICVFPPTLTDVTVRLMVSVPRSKSMASHFKPLLLRYNKFCKLVCRL